MKWGKLKNRRAPYPGVSNRQRKILNGEFQPNERLVESKLAEQIGVSRGTVREAIRMLTKDELIEQRDSYLFVYNPSQNDIIDIYECRRSLELLSVRLAAQKITDDQLIDLNRIIKYSKEALEKMIRKNWHA